jgi:transposase
MEISLDSHGSDGRPVGTNRSPSGKEGDPGRSGEDNRRFLEGILWVVHKGTPWRDLPDEIGN